MGCREYLFSADMSLKAFLKIVDILTKKNLNVFAALGIRVAAGLIVQFIYIKMITDPLERGLYPKSEEYEICKDYYDTCYSLPVEMRDTYKKGEEFFCSSIHGDLVNQVYKDQVNINKCDHFIRLTNSSYENYISDYDEAIDKADEVRLFKFKTLGGMILFFAVIVFIKGIYKADSSLTYSIFLTVIECFQLFLDMQTLIIIDGVNLLSVWDILEYLDLIYNGLLFANQAILLAVMCCKYKSIEKYVLNIDGKIVTQDRPLNVKIVTKK